MLNILFINFTKHRYHKTYPQKFLRTSAVLGKILQKNTVISIEYVSQFSSRSLTNGPFTVLHFANVTAWNPGKLGKLLLGQFFPVTNAFQICAVWIRDKFWRDFSRKNSVINLYSTSRTGIFA